MHSGIFGFLNDKNVTPHLFQGLQRLESEYGKYEKISIATIVDGRIRHLQMSGKTQDLQSLLQKHPLEGHFSIVYMRLKHSEYKENHRSEKCDSFLCATENVAVAHHGFIENLEEIRDELIGLGYEFKTTSDCEVILCLINRYLDIGISPIESMMVSLARLQGYFAIIALFANPYDLFISARRGYSLAIGVNENRFYVGSDTRALSLFSRQVMQLEEGNPVILRTVAKNLAYAFSPCKSV